MLSSKLRVFAKDQTSPQGRGEFFAVLGAGVGGVKQETSLEGQAGFWDAKRAKRRLQLLKSHKQARSELLPYQTVKY